MQRGGDQREREVEYLILQKGVPPPEYNPLCRDPTGRLWLSDCDLPSKKEKKK